MLSIARALMARPRLLLLDEPSLGLAPLIVKQIFDAIRELNATQKLTVFLVEQNAYHALKLAHRGYVMVNGRDHHVAAPARELLEKPEVRAAYLEGGSALSGRTAMQGILYEESSVWLFLLVTCVLGGGGAWMTGRACAHHLASPLSLRACSAASRRRRRASSITPCSPARCSRCNTMSSTPSCS